MCVYIYIYTHKWCYDLGSACEKARSNLFTVNFYPLFLFSVCAYQRSVFGSTKQHKEFIIGARNVVCVLGLSTQTISCWERCFTLTGLYSCSWSFQVSVSSVYLHDIIYLPVTEYSLVSWPFYVLTVRGFLRCDRLSVAFFGGFFSYEEVPGWWFISFLYKWITVCLRDAQSNRVAQSSGVLPRHPQTAAVFSHGTLPKTHSECPTTTRASPLVCLSQ